MVVRARHRVGVRRVGAIVEGILKGSGEGVVVPEITAFGVVHVWPRGVHEPASRLCVGATGPLVEGQGACPGLLHEGPPCITGRVDDAADRLRGARRRRVWLRDAVGHATRHARRRARQRTRGRSGEGRRQRRRGRRRPAPYVRTREVVWQRRRAPGVVVVTLAVRVVDRRATPTAVVALSTALGGRGDATDKATSRALHPKADVVRESECIACRHRRFGAPPTRCSRLLVYQAFR